MKLIKQSVELLQIKDYNRQEIMKHIELCGRTCYKSEDKITNNSYEDFVKMIINRGHLSVLEHAPVYLRIENKPNIAFFYEKNPYSQCRSENYEDIIHVSTNYRVIIENKKENDLFFLDAPLETNNFFYNRRYTFKIITDRGISHELVRHRVFSFSQESSRYCNYSQNKFNNELTFIQPCWITDEHIRIANTAPILISKESNNAYTFQRALEDVETIYLGLLANGWKPEQARNVLPNTLKTEIVMTGFYNDWIQFLKMRTSEAAHPQMREIAFMIQNLLP